MRNNKVTFVYSEDHDWVAMYIDGKKVTEGHSVEAREALEHLDFEVETKHVTNDWAEDNGFPDDESKCEVIDE